MDPAVVVPLLTAKIAESKRRKGAAQLVGSAVLTWHRRKKYKAQKARRLPHAIPALALCTHPRPYHPLPRLTRALPLGIITRRMAPNPQPLH